MSKSVSVSKTSTTTSDLVDQSTLISSGSGDGTPPEGEGLQPLALCDSVTVRRNMSLECMYNYTVHASNGNEIYYASEEDIQYCDTTDARKRAFILEITDLNSRLILRSMRPMKNLQSYKLLRCGLFCKLQAENIKDYMLVTEEGTLHEKRGYIRQQRYYGRPIYHILGPNKETEYVLRGPRKRRSPLDCTFNISLKKKKKPVGKIEPLISIDDHDIKNVLVNYYKIHFPNDICVELKAVILAGSFLINCMFYSPRIDKRLSAFYGEEELQMSRRREKYEILENDFFM